MNLYLILCILGLSTFSNGETDNTIVITEANLETVLTNSELVFVNFYANWCRFSRQLAPIFGNAFDEVQKQFPQPGLVTLAKVDCESEAEVAKKYNVNKYPTMKLFRNGQLTKREFRGQRTVDSLVAFVREQLKDPIHHFKTEDEMDDFEPKKRSVIGYFTSKDSNYYANFERIAKSLKDDCEFFAAFDEVSKKERQSGDNIIFRPAGGDPDMVYLGSLNNFDLLKAWTTDKCVPLVREITFQNGEELTEEGLPFLILFHKKEDTESLEVYQKVLSRTLIHEKARVTFLEADCDTFSHPLHHLGKSPKDCPLIAVDSFKHMYLFPNFSDLTVPGKLGTFLQDLHSGKLHREFHHGPDQVENQDPSQPEVPQKAETTIKVEQGSKKEEPKTTPPESIFKNLQPSEHRYTILNSRDEL